MIGQERPFTIGAVAVLAVTATLSLAAGASGGTLIQMSTDVPKSNGDGQDTVSMLHGLDNLPPAIDLDIFGVSVTETSGNSSGKYLLLTAPNSGNVLLFQGCADLGFNLTFDDSAASAFSAPGSCMASGTRRPASGVINYLMQGDPEFGPPGIGGDWEMNLFDPAGGPSGVARLNSWGLRVTFEPMTCAARGDKQELKKKVEVEIKCDSDTRVTTGGDAKRRTVSAHAGKDTLKVPLKGGARDRLEGGGKAKIKLEATNELGDLAALKAKVKVTD